MEDVKILKIEKKGKKYLVYASSETEPLKLFEDDIVNNRLIKGSVIPGEAWKKMKKTFSSSRLFDSTLHFIDYKLRTTYEVVNYLKQKEATSEEINEIIKKCEDIHYLDDDRYARMFIQEGIKNKKGPILIRYNLENLGIEKSLIDKYLVLYDDEKLIENALEIGQKYLRTITKHPEKKQRELVYQKLVRSGFSNSIINQVLNQLTYDNSDILKLETEYLLQKKKTNDSNKIITALMMKGYRYEDIKKVIKK